MKKPDFFLSSPDEEVLKDVRACFLLGRIFGTRKGGYWRARVIPAVCVTGQPDVTEVILAEVGASAAISKLRAEPVSVYVCVIRNIAAVERGRIKEEDITLIARGEVALLPSALLSEQRGTR